MGEKKEKQDADGPKYLHTLQQERSGGDPSRKLPRWRERLCEFCRNDRVRGKVCERPPAAAGDRQCLITSEDRR